MRPKCLTGAWSASCYPAGPLTTRAAKLSFGHILNSRKDKATASIWGGAKTAASPFPLVSANCAQAAHPAGFQAHSPSQFWSPRPKLVRRSFLVFLIAFLRPDNLPPWDANVRLYVVVVKGVYQHIVLVIQMPLLHPRFRPAQADPTNATACSFRKRFLHRGDGKGFQP